MNRPATPLLQALQENATFVRSLARSLVGTDHGAEDLSQETWLAAFEHPPEHEGNVRAWLGTVVRRLAGRKRREASRRAVREVAHARSEVELGTIDAIAWEDTLRRVSGAVLSLEEPDRATILLRYYEGLSATAIATRMGVPASTVRGRLQRALARLRVILDQRSGGDREAWIRGLIPLIGGKFGSGGSVVGLASAGGVVVMGATAKVTIGIIAAACVGALGWWGMELLAPPEHINTANAPVLMPIVTESPAEADPVAEPVVDDREEMVQAEDAVSSDVPSEPPALPEPMEAELPAHAVPLPPLDQMSLDALEAELTRRTNPLYEGLFASGLYDVIQQPITEEKLLNEKLVALRFETDNITVHRAVLPEADHPEEYAIWREILSRRKQQREEELRLREALRDATKGDGR